MFDIKDAERFSEDYTIVSDFFVAKDSDGVAQGLSEEGPFAFSLPCLYY